ncbi:hypothetical protein [Candidatus Tokpelaia sp.]|uniref:hypothetical protein n=1 Tax=Candidatus Tokpelaia sp. TaxID=2233777 RepID=UPI001680762C|nr:hypothetical protein [Candidatus Tokpelaia sp.]
MAQMNNRQAQVIDPILTEYARGYKNSEFIGQLLLPTTPIPNRSMKVLRFGKEAFRQYLDTRRAPGAETKRIAVGYTADPVALRQDALDAVVPIELMQDAAAVPNVDLAAHSVKVVQDIIALGNEVATASLLRDPVNYPTGHVIELTGAQRWSEATSNPAADIKAAGNIVRLMIGRRPNMLTLSPRVFDVLSLHPVIKEQFKYTTADSLTMEMLAAYFQVEKVLVGEAVALAENAKDTDPAEDVWGNDVLLTYSPKDGNYMVPAFGYTYTLSGYPIVEEARWEGNKKSWVYGVTEEKRPYITGAEGGILFRSPAGKQGDGGGSADGGKTQKLFASASVSQNEAVLAAQVSQYLAANPALINDEVEKALAANTAKAEAALKKAAAELEAANKRAAAAEAEAASAKAAAEAAAAGTAKK